MGSDSCLSFVEQKIQTIIRLLKLLQTRLVVPSSALTPASGIYSVWFFLNMGRLHEILECFFAMFLDCKEPICKQHFVKS